MALRGKSFGLLIVGAILMAGVSVLMVNLIIGMEYRRGFNEGKTKGLEEGGGAKIETGNTLELPTFNRVDVLVARQDIAPGNPVLPEAVEMKKIPEDLLPTGAITSLEDIKDLWPAHFIPAGDILMVSKLRTAAEIRRASYLVEPGKRYISLVVNPEQTVSSMLRIGDRVDILATYTRGASSMSKIIIQNIRIIDVVGGDAQAATNPKKDAPNEAPRPRLGQGSTITFEVTPEEAELFKALQAAENEGLNFTFILRNIGDTAVVETEGKRVRDVVASIEPEEAVAQPVIPTPQPIDPVTTPRRRPGL